jgi:periplasmic protein TonB
MDRGGDLSGDLPVPIDVGKRVSEQPPAAEYHCVEMQYQWFKRWAQVQAKKWALKRTKWRAQLWAFLLGPYVEAPPSESRRMARFGSRSVFVALGVAGACHLAGGLVLYTILGAWTAAEGSRPHVRTVIVHLLPASSGVLLESPPSLAVRPDVPAPPTGIPPPRPIARTEVHPASEGKITPKKQSAAAPVVGDTVAASGSDGGDGGVRGGADGTAPGGAPAGGSAFVAFDTPPQRLSEIEPEYPEVAIAARSQGTVLVLITIDETGTVTDAVVIKSDVISALEAAALKAAKATPFRPAKQRDVPVVSRVVLPFRFKLKTEEGS